LFCRSPDLGSETVVLAPAVTAKGIFMPQAGIETVPVVLSVPVIKRKSSVSPLLHWLQFGVKVIQKSVPLQSRSCAFALFVKPVNYKTII
jgi:hypothetical protein